MIDTPLSLVANDDVDEAPPSASALIDVLSDALRGRTVPPQLIRAKGEMASSGEGLALVQSFIAIEDPRLRQAILYAAAALAKPERR